MRNGPITLAEAQSKFYEVRRGKVGPLYAVTYLAGKIAHRLVSKQAEKAYQKLLDEALLNPEVAAALLKAENPANRAALARAAKGWQVYEAGQQNERDHKQDHSAQQRHGLCIAQRVKQPKKYQRDKHNIQYAQPADSLKYEKDVVEDFSHSFG